MLYLIELRSICVIILQCHRPNIDPANIIFVTSSRESHGPAGPMIPYNAEKLAQQRRASHLGNRHGISAWVIVVKWKTTASASRRSPRSWVTPHPSFVIDPSGGRYDFMFHGAPQYSINLLGSVIKLGRTALARISDQPE